ncbi:hypothetical protein HHO41_00780 [Bacillus sp. DNRA2]|uniref:DUF6056 family protein n=1 Tax=Bacillus sp. DNRA2 TaxID=2723053 RepID=UPI00145C92A5|nr:DUF6056 family protein [Bacillus sp. DNRA2]NMD68802.1 hypothetical protein [Bacillus sp. DNRA2]
MKKSVNYLFFISVYIIVYLLHFKITIIKGSDDTVFTNASDTPFFDWISTRYFTWSGRLFPDTMVYVLLDEYLWLWRILNAAFLMLLAYGIVRLIKKEVKRSEFLTSLLVIGFFAEAILRHGLFWITGTVNYLWPIALGIIAMIPFAEKILGKQTVISNKLIVIAAFSGIIASISNEQVALCMSTFSIISLVVDYLRHKTIDKKLISLAGLILIGSCILLLAPGNAVRWEEEVGRWFPGYDELTLKSKFHLGIIWLYERFFVVMRHLVLLLALFVFIYYKDKFKEINKYKTVYVIFSTQLFFAISSVLLNIQSFYNFGLINSYRISHSIFQFWKSDLGFLIAIFPYVFWTLFSVCLLILIINMSKHPVFVFLCLAAAVATLMVMFFSPTIYASIERTQVVASVLIAIVISHLLIEKGYMENKLNIIILSCYPILNITHLLSNW